MGGRLAAGRRTLARRAAPEATPVVAFPQRLPSKDVNTSDGSSHAPADGSDVCRSSTRRLETASEANSPSTDSPPSPVVPSANADANAFSTCGWNSGSPITPVAARSPASTTETPSVADSLPTPARAARRGARPPRARAARRSPARDSARRRPCAPSPSRRTEPSPDSPRASGRAPPRPGAPMTAGSSARPGGKERGATLKTTAATTRTGPNTRGNRDGSRMRTPMARLSQAMLPAATRTSVTPRGSKRDQPRRHGRPLQEGQEQHAQDDEQQRPLEARPARRS